MNSFPVSLPKLNHFFRFFLFIGTWPTVFPASPLSNFFFISNFSLYELVWLKDLLCATGDCGWLILDCFLKIDQIDFVTRFILKPSFVIFVLLLS